MPRYQVSGARDDGTTYNAVVEAISTTDAITWLGYRVRTNDLVGIMVTGQHTPVAPGQEAGLHSMNAARVASLPSGFGQHMVPQTTRRPDGDHTDSTGDALMALRHVPVGSVIERVYYAVPDHYTIGTECETWDEAVLTAQERHRRLTETLKESLRRYSSPEQIEASVDAQVRIDLRWVIRQPDGTQYDTPMEKYGDVMRLETGRGLTGR